ncbi:TetR/AcrR family transcriptional regulator [Psychromicrobium sp. YIM B11713]|uniref:TetR/AcrR family transcriptional regulator n=1 Tax=Psychromicrobium sp. YIM B11713 TaxID=3145233 RepID=UPI00374F92B6
MSQNSDHAPGGKFSSVWLRDRDPQPDGMPLSSGRITSKAIEILDSRGLDALTMRTLAKELEISAPSLYWHIRTKEEVIELAIDQVFSELPIPKESAPWRGRIHSQLTAWRDLMIRHPWVPSEALRRVLLGPNFLAQLETLQSTLHGAGFEGQQHLTASWLLYNQVMGSASARSAMKLGEADLRLSQQFIDSQSERYPALARSHYLRDEHWDQNFSAGLNYLLDGLERQLSDSSKS